MDDTSLKQKLAERFNQLPQVVRDTITSANVEKRLRELANTHKLHLDQWESLENEVMLALFGIQPTEHLIENIQKEVGVSEDVAERLGEDVSRIVFEPIRQELERQLEHPEAVEKKESDVDKMRSQMLSRSAPTPSTPPPAAPTAKVERAPVTSSYAGSTPSHERKAIEGDPYREPVV